MIGTFLKGMCVGGTMMVPGVSGGSMAMILGIYDQLVSAVSSFTKDIRKNTVFLGAFCAGGGLGILLLSGPILYLLEQFELPTLYFFIGAIGGSIPMIGRQAGVRTVTWEAAGALAAGVILVFATQLLPSELLSGGREGSIMQSLLLLAAGMVAAVALVLPGISVSYMLLVFGLYDRLIYGIRELDILFLLPFGVGLLLGIVLTTRMLERFLTAYPQTAYLMILGFVIGSVAQVFPGLPSSVAEAVLCLASTVLGAVLLHSLELAGGEERRAGGSREHGGRRRESAYRRRRHGGRRR